MTVPSESWVERAVDRSAAVQRSRTRIANQVRLMLDAARRLIGEKDDFTTQELVAEAGVALQTFYRYFTSKDELLLALIGDAMTEACDHWAEAAADATRPDGTVAVLRHRAAGADSKAIATKPPPCGSSSSTHWHLHRIFPKELAEVEQPFVDLIVAEINSAADAGLLQPRNPEWDAWFVVELLRSVNHYYAYAAKTGDDLNVTKENLWQFCRTALGVRG